MAINFLSGIDVDNGVLYTDTANNRVGIGTPSPSYTLDVNGIIRGEQYLRLADTGGTNRFSIRAESTYGTIDNGSNTLNYNANNHLFLVGLSEKMRINSSGNVGIGTTNPSRKLQVIGTDGAAKFYYHSSFTNAQYPVVDIGMMTSGTAANGFGPKINFRMGENGYDGYVSGSIGTVRNGADGTHNMTFGTSTSGSTSTKMVITNAGNVGIGTTSPTEKLFVNGGNAKIETTGTTYLKLNSNTSFPSVQIQAERQGAASPPMGQLRWDSNPGATGMQLHYWNGYTENSLRLDGSNFRVTNNGSERMRINSSGNVGIGTTTPGEKLEVNGIVKAVDGYKGYVSHFHNVGFFHNPRSTDGANPLWIPINSTATTSSDQYYNTWVPLYAGRIRKIILKHISGSTPTATVCTFRKKINGVLSGTTYAGTVTDGGAAGMKVTFDFGTTNFTFSAEDEVQIGVVTGVATQPGMGGVSCQIWYEYNIT